MHSVDIRDLQHFLYCPHRWGLIRINDIWAENIFVIKANLAHENVHSQNKTSSKSGVKRFNSVRIYNDDLDIYGVTDALEVSDGHYCIVEYKPHVPKAKTYSESDAMQVFAQKVCIDSIFQTSCDAHLYYTSEKKRVKLPFDKEYQSYMDKLQQTLEQIRYFLERDEVPGIPEKQNCNGCSFVDICMPKKHLNSSVFSQIDRLLEDS